MSLIFEFSKKIILVFVLFVEKFEGGEGLEEGDKLLFLLFFDLNIRFRRIIISFQRNYKRMFIKNVQRVKVN